jgi:hypothetical protein
MNDKIVWFTGWLLAPEDRLRLLAIFGQRYERLVAEHVTLATDADADVPAPEQERGLIVGEADDGQGVQALVVSIRAATDRPGGGTYHITWSLGSEREPVESNAVIAERGWRVVAPVGVDLIPVKRPMP